MNAKRLKKAMVISISVITILYVAFCILFYTSQENFLFPAKKIADDYKIDSSLNFEELTLKVSDEVQLSGILFNANQPKGIVLHFHGNEQNILDMESLAKPFVDMGYSFVSMDYRTYGKSTGTLSEENLFLDAKLFLELLEKRGWKQSDIILMGHSIGTGIATQLASISNTKALILYAPYYTFKDLISEKMPILPIGMLIKYPLNSAKYMESVNCPVLILHGTLDELVPINHAKKLSKINGKLISIENGEHENLTEFDEFWMGISQFLK